MKKYIYSGIIALLFMSCFSQSLYAQNAEVKDISTSQNLNYIFANTFWGEVEKFDLPTYQVTIVRQGAPLETPEDYFDGTDEILMNLYVSIAQDGEYSGSKLYEIPLLAYPKVLKVEQSEDNEILVGISFRNKEGKLLKEKFKLSAEQ